MPNSGKTDANGHARRLSRRAFLGLTGGGLVAVSTPSYAKLIEPEWIEFSEQTVDLGRGNRERPIRAVHLSDLHLLPTASRHYLHRVFDHVALWKPDLIFVTGDFITRTVGMPENYAPSLKRLSAVAPTFACMGNHDGGFEGGFASSEEMRAMIAEAGFQCPHNAHTTFTVGQRTIEIVGLGDLWSGEFRPEIAFPPAAPARLERIVLAHNPDSKNAIKKYEWDLMLSGHTHGGQIGIPWFRENIVPVYDKRFIAGLYSWDGRQLYISRGVGNLYNIRFLCRPQATLLTLV